MTDRERVIFDIERCICHVPDACRDCSKCGGDNALRCMEDLLKDALELLKEQEAVEPIMAREGRNKYWSYYVCPNCNDDLSYGQKYCSECGRAVKWNDDINMP